MDLLVALFEVGKSGWEHLKEIYDNISRLEEKVDILTNKMEELDSQAKDVTEQLVRSEMQQGKKRKREVEVWLKNVQRITHEVQTVDGEFIEERGYLKRLKLGKLVTKKIAEVFELKEKGVFSDGLVIDLLPDTGKILPMTSLVVETEKKTLEEIWNCLMDIKIGKIGVHGVEGVGKTAIMKHINNRLVEAYLFKSIIWVTVSKVLTLKKLQSEIAKAIGLVLLDDEDERSRSAKVFEALMERRRFVLILDDMSEAFSLEDIGIPEPNKANGCKLIFTTRSLGVCRCMETQIDIEVKELPEEEAWELFKEKAGGDWVLSSDIEAIAKLVAAECNRMPLKIITVARALRRVDDIMIWKNMLDKLRGSRDDTKTIKDFTSPSPTCSALIPGIILHPTIGPFEEFHIVANNVLLDKYIGTPLRRSYWELCSVHGSLLHDSAVLCSPYMLSGAISSIAHVANKIRLLTFDSPFEEFEHIQSLLPELESNGMDVSLLRKRLNDLMRIRQTPIPRRVTLQVAEESRLLEHDQRTIQGIKAQIIQLSKDEEVVSNQVTTRCMIIRQLEEHADARKDYDHLVRADWGKDYKKSCVQEEDKNYTHEGGMQVYTRRAQSKRKSNHFSRLSERE